MAAIPTELVVTWAYNRARLTYATLDVPTSRLHMSKWTFSKGLMWLLDFLKGWGSVVLLSNYLTSDSTIMATLCGIAILHYWSPFSSFQKAPNSWFFLFGVSTGIYPLSLILFPLFCICLALLLNTWALPVLLSGVVLFFIMNATIPFSLTFAYVMIFGISTLYYAPIVIAHLDTKKYSLLSLYKRRKLG